MLFHPCIHLKIWNEDWNLCILVYRWVWKICQGHCLLKEMMLYMASEYCLSTDGNRGGIKQPLLTIHLTLIKWMNKCTSLMAIKSTGNFFFPSASMQCSRLILLVLMFYFFTPAGPTSSYGIVSQNCQEDFYELWSQCNLLGSDCF